MKISTRTNRDTNLGIAAQAVGVLTELFDNSETPQEVADYLANIGVKGDRSCPDTCALAVHLKNRIPVSPDHAWYIGFSTVSLRTSGTLEVLLYVDGSEVYTDFLASFDHGFYPKLIAEKE